MSDILEPCEAWDAAEQEVDSWQEEENREERLKWRMLNIY